MNTILFPFFFLLLTLGCADKSGVNDTSELKKDTVTNTQQTIESSFKDQKFLDGLRDIPTRNFPVVDSTNFDNYDGEHGIKAELFINKIQFRKINPGAVQVRLRYRLHFSDQFNSIVVSYYVGEHELFTSLLNINENHQIIGQLTIAYDEIAESALRKISTINKDKIVVDDFNYMNEETPKKTQTYFVTAEGKFQIN